MTQPPALAEEATATSPANKWDVLKVTAKKLTRALSSPLSFSRDDQCESALEYSDAESRSISQSKRAPLAAAALCVTAVLLGGALPANAVTGAPASGTSPPHHCFPIFRLALIQIHANQGGVAYSSSPSCAGPIAQLGAAAAVNGADTAWILTSTALVLFMSIPGLALFYGGLVREKNVLQTLSMVRNCPSDP